MNDQSNRPQRQRIPNKAVRGQLVASTNPTQLSCIIGKFALKVIHYYNPDTHQRLGRYPITINNHNK